MNHTGIMATAITFVCYVLLYDVMCVLSLLLMNAAGGISIANIAGKLS